MKKEKVTRNEMTLVGLSIRTNNKIEANLATAKIPILAGTYFTSQASQSFKERTTPGVTYAVYTDYESDEYGDYTYFIGEEVSTLNGQDLEKLNSLIIKESTYQKFTTNPGKFPMVVIDAWKSIWQMKPNDFETRRKYIADFEVYDARSYDLDNAIVDIYIGTDS